MYAAEHDNKDIVKFLMASRANINIKDVNGKTALDYAKEYKDKTKISRYY